MQWFRWMARLVETRFQGCCKIVLVIAVTMVAIVGLAKIVILIKLLQIRKHKKN